MKGNIEKVKIKRFEFASAEYMYMKHTAKSVVSSFEKPFIVIESNTQIHLKIVFIDQVTHTHFSEFKTKINGS